MMPSGEYGILFWYSSIEFLIHQMAPSDTLAASYIKQHLIINNSRYLEMP